MNGKQAGTGWKKKGHVDYARQKESQEHSGSTHIGEKGNEL